MFCNISIEKSLISVYSGRKFRYVPGIIPFLLRPYLHQRSLLLRFQFLHLRSIKPSPLCSRSPFYLRSASQSTCSTIENQSLSSPPFHLSRRRFLSLRLLLRRLCQTRKLSPSASLQIYSSQLRSSVVNPPPRSSIEASISTVVLHFRLLPRSTKLRREALLCLHRSSPSNVNAGIKPSR